MQCDTELGNGSSPIVERCDRQALGQCQDPGCSSHVCKKHGTICCGQLFCDGPCLEEHRRSAGHVDAAA